MEDLDRQIASVMDCNPLLEDEVVRLCEKVWTGPDACWGRPDGPGRAAACVQHARRPASLPALWQLGFCVSVG